ncbi:MAG: glycerol-3-phosphate dehydrogenase C-terminal domain-containing protein, partial [Blastocatellia bacterium]
ISGGELGRYELATIAERLAQTEKLPPETAQHLVYSYGANYQRLIELMREDEQLREHLVEGLPQLLVEIVYAARHELALTLADVMTRRLRLAMLAGEDSLQCAAVAADLMARELGWNPEEVERQIAQFQAEFEREYSVSNAAL